MNKENKNSQDMSVEDILKSIRGIINSTSNITPDNEEEDILELTNVVSDNKSNESEEDSLLSGESATKVTEILKQFSEKITISAREDKMLKSLTIEELVVAMVRPQLKKWLDENLPSLVRELVEKEIKQLIPTKEK